jgi:2-dehydro-3-deoxyphosphooctonate aldolase (KDO 8-P synthase)
MVKKGQFLQPGSMQYVAEKIKSTGNNQILLCERGSCWGHGDLVVDFRGLEIMAETGYPVIFDASHCVQQTFAEQGNSGGQRHFIPALARAAVAVGVAGIFIETHENPASARSDASTQWHLRELPALLQTLLEIHALRQRQGGRGPE